MHNSSASQDPVGNKSLVPRPASNKALSSQDESDVRIAKMETELAKMERELAKTSRERDEMMTQITQLRRDLNDYCDQVYLSCKEHVSLQVKENNQKLAQFLKETSQTLHNSWNKNHSDEYNDTLCCVSWAMYNISEKLTRFAQEDFDTDANQSEDEWSIISENDGAQEAKEDSQNYTQPPSLPEVEGDFPDSGEGLDPLEFPSLVDALGTKSMASKSTVVTTPSTTEKFTKTKSSSSSGESVGQLPCIFYNYRNWKGEACRLCPHRDCGFAHMVVDPRDLPATTIDPEKYWWWLDKVSNPENHKCQYFNARDSSGQPCWVCPWGDDCTKEHEPITDRDNLRRVYYRKKLWPHVSICRHFNTPVSRGGRLTMEDWCENGSNCSFCHVQVGNSFNFGKPRTIRVF